MQNFISNFYAAVVILVFFPSFVVHEYDLKQFAFRLFPGVVSKEMGSREARKFFGKLGR